MFSKCLLVNETVKILSREHKFASQVRRTSLQQVQSCFVTDIGSSFPLSKKDSNALTNLHLNFFQQEQSCFATDSNIGSLFPLSIKTTDSSERLHQTFIHLSKPQSQLCTVTTNNTCGSYKLPFYVESITGL